MSIGNVKISKYKKRIDKLKNIYKINDRVEFLNRYGQWIKGIIVDFNKKSNRYQAVIMCNNPDCKLHKICICSIHLRKVETDITK